jgi:hypothetical protein
MGRATCEKRNSTFQSRVNIFSIDKISPKNEIKFLIIKNEVVLEVFNHQK